MNTRLVTRRINHPTDAAICAGEWNVQGNDKITPMIFIPEAGCSPFLTIPQGFYSIITTWGKFAAIAKAGLRIVKPWEKISHMVTIQYIVYDTPVKECPTSDNVMVEVDVSVVISIKEFEEDVKSFVYELGPERLEAMLKAFQEEAVRTMARQKKYSSIYDLMDTEELELPKQVALQQEKDAETAGAIAGELASEPVQGMEMQEVKKPASYIHADLNGDGKVNASEQLENTKRAMNEKLDPYGVAVYSITITNVLLPREFRNQMEEATTFESKNIRQAAEQKYNLLVINDNETRAKAEQALMEELQEAEAKNHQRVAHELKITNLFEAGTRRIMADIQEKMKADVLDITSTSDLEVAKVDRAKKVELANIDAKADAEVVKIRTEMNAFVLTQQAECKAKVAENEAEMLKFQANAEKIAATKLVSQRDFAAKMANLRVLKNLARNDRVAISGTNTDSVVAQMVAAKNSAIALGLN